MAKEDLRETIELWLATDPDPETRAIAQKMLASADDAELRDHFGQSLRFGTAGLRGALGPGPNRMNRVNVRRVTAGLAAYVVKSIPDAALRGVVVAYDGRHKSRVFAADAVGVLADAGLNVYHFDQVQPTPRLAHAVKHLNAAAGVMVTASHNPPQDNGYKVYWENGALIIPPHEQGISDAIDAVSVADLKEIGAQPDEVGDRARGHVRLVGDDVRDAYIAGICGMRVHHETGIRIVYTAMHGVGRRLLERVLKRVGHDDIHVVAEQAEPDGDFPTVNFPNPEEPGALDLSLALAARVDADVILANDPDADRLAVGVRDGEGGYRVLTGNQVGALLGADLLEYGPSEGDRLVATTVVSSPMLSRIAGELGARYAETLTGLKWVANHAIDHEARGGRFVFGYEEALGYASGTVVRDKDGISAALLICDLVAWCRSRGISMLDHLASLYRRFGAYASAQRNTVFRGPDRAKRMLRVMEQLRGSPPEQLAGIPVAQVRDYLINEARDMASGKRTALGLPASNVLGFDLADGCRIMVRPSGTEPKIKIYVDVREPMSDKDSLPKVESRMSAKLERLADAAKSAAGGLD